MPSTALATSTVAVNCRSRTSTFIFFVVILQRLLLPQFALGTLSAREELPLFLPDGNLAYEIELPTSLLLRKWILKRSSVKQPLEVGNELGAYNVFLFGNHVPLLGAAVDCWNLFVENDLEAQLLLMILFFRNTLWLFPHKNHFFPRPLSFPPLYWWSQ